MTLLANWSHAVNTVIFQFKQNVPLLGRAFGLLCVVHLMNVLSGRKLCVLGIYPRSLHGLFGILWAPLLHANGEHLISNLLILIILANMVAVSGQAVLVVVTMLVIVVGGLLTWTFGRKALHIGASGVAMGYFGFVLMEAYHHPGLITLSIAAVGLYYLAGLLMHLMPVGRQDSWESHLFGFLAGLLASKCYPWLLTWPWLKLWMVAHGFGVA